MSLFAHLDQPIPVTDLVLRLSLAALFGGLLGWERELQHKAAGLRTHMMIALGAALFTLMAFEMFAEGEPKGSGVDPSRVIQGIVGGLGFLGAGQILQAGGTVQGMTTAAGIWVVGAVGIACGSGYFLLASITVGFALAIMAGVGLLESRLFKQPPHSATVHRLRPRGQH